MTSIADSPVTIQTTAQSVPSTPSWFGEVTLVAHYLRRQNVLSEIEEQVRFARRRCGQYDVIDFVAVLLGYAISGERTLEAFYERLQPFANAFMALFDRDRLPHRSTLSRFLASLDQPTVEALRMVFLKDLVTRPLEKQEKPGGLWDRQGTQWWVFDVDGTRQAARQRALPHTPELPTAQRRMSEVCAPGYLGRKRGEVVRTRTTVLQAHTHQWVGTFGGVGNGEYRGELGRAGEAIRAYIQAHGHRLAQTLVRLDGQYGNGAIVVDLADLPYVMRGKDYHLLDLPEVQARLTRPPDFRTTHPETGTTRALYDCPNTAITATGETCRMIVATHPAATTPAPVGTTREKIVYELFFTALPQVAFTAADVVALYLHRGAFETVLADEDQEQDPDRWCSHTVWGQEGWQILSQWIWNLRLELGHQLQAHPLRLTEFAEAQAAEPEKSAAPEPRLSEYGSPQVVPTSRMGCLPGSEFPLQADGTLRCPAGHPLYLQERRPEGAGTLRLVYAARIGHCRPCRLREACQGYGASTDRPRRVSALAHLLPAEARAHPRAPLQPGSLPLIWGDWPRRQHRRTWMQLLRCQRVDVQINPSDHLEQEPAERLLSRPQRAHWRLSWQQRFMRNARPKAAPAVHITLFGFPQAFAESMSLPTL